MRNSITLGLVSLFLFVGTSSGEFYVGTDRLVGVVVASPQSRSGGDDFITENEKLLEKDSLPGEIRGDLKIKSGRRAERWVEIEVEESYIHCSKHIPLLKKLEKSVDWGTDDEVKKGGDFFKAKKFPSPWQE